MILPLGFFLAILLTYGRLYMDSEMVVLEACGMSRAHLLGCTMVPGVAVMLVVGICSFWLTPWGVENVARIFNVQKAMTEFDTLTPGRFQVLDQGRRVTYAERLSADKSVMTEVFIAQEESTIDGSRGKVSILLADSARLYPDPVSGKRYLLLHNGYRHDVTPGGLEGRVMKYETYGVQMKEREVQPVNKENTLPFADLVGSDHPFREAELQWRVSMPLLIPIIILMALPLARVNPRQGRFFKLFPGILLYLFYLAMLMTARAAIEDGNFSPDVGLWAVHGVFGTMALLMFFAPQLHIILSNIVNKKLRKRLEGMHR